MGSREVIEINGCKHHVLNSVGSERMFFTDSEFFVEKDINTQHPMGAVVKPLNCIDTQIRFVRHTDNKIFMFKIADWDKKTNPFSKKYQQKTLLNLVNLF